MGYAVAVVVSIIAMYMKFRVFYQQLRYRRRYLDTPEARLEERFDDEADQAATSKWNKRRGKLLVHENRLVKTSRKIKLITAGVLVASLECLPLGILQLAYSQRATSKLGMIDMLSLVTSWLMFGVKIS